MEINKIKKNTISKAKKLHPKANDNPREMWAAVSRSLEMIVALFEYYSSTVVSNGGTAPLDETAQPASTECRYYLP